MFNFFLSFWPKKKQTNELLLSLVLQTQFTFVIFCFSVDLLIIIILVRNRRRAKMNLTKLVSSIQLEYKLDNRLKFFFYPTFTSIRQTIHFPKCCSHLMIKNQLFLWKIENVLKQFERKQTCNVYSSHFFQWFIWLDYIFIYLNQF